MDFNAVALEKSDSICIFGDCCVTLSTDYNRSLKTKNYDICRKL